MNARLRAGVLIAGVVALDRVTKLYIRAHVSGVDVYPVIPRFFNIVHTENPGAAFGLFSDSPTEWRGILLVGISAAVMTILGVMLWRMAATQSRVTTIGLALVFCGALGNLVDRLFRGTVTDFVQLFFGSYEFPSFNVADSAITIGAGLLVIDLWRSRKSRA
jgi:signal peptidase II